MITWLLRIVWALGGVVCFALSLLGFVFLGDPVLTIVGAVGGAGCWARIE